MMPRGHTNIRGELVRIVLGFGRKHFEKPQSLQDIRRRIRSLERFIPRPPRSFRTSRVNADGVSADLISTPTSVPGRHVLYLHGGAYAFCGPATYRHFTWRIGAVTQANVLVPDYRLAPEHPFPAALEDAARAYRWLLKAQDPNEVVVMGDSAGGGLALALLLKLRDEQEGLPAGAVVLSPWTDLALTGASFASNAPFDMMLDAAEVPRFADNYLAGRDPRDPYASPLYGDPSGLPPTLFFVGGEEILRDDSIRMAEKMRGAGCQVELRMQEKMPHVWPAFAPILPEARFAIAEIGRFARRVLAKPSI